jgi:hypothetical protein
MAAMAETAPVAYHSPACQVRWWDGLRVRGGSSERRELDLTVMPRRSNTSVFVAVRRSGVFPPRLHTGRKEMAGRLRRGSRDLFYTSSSWPRRQVARGAWRDTRRRRSVAGRPLY